MAAEDCLNFVHEDQPTGEKASETFKVLEESFNNIDINLCFTSIFFVLLLSTFT